MKDMMDLYYQMMDEKNPKLKYGYGLKLVKRYFEKGDMHNAEHSFGTLLLSHAEAAGVSKEQVEIDLNRSKRKGMKLCVPRLFKELEDAVAEPGAKNFKYLTHTAEKIFNYATECRMYSLSEICKINDRLDGLSGKIFNMKKDTAPDTSDWQVADIKDAAREMGSPCTVSVEEILDNI